MLVSGGKVIAIDSIARDESLSGNGVWQPLGINSSAVIDPIYDKISALSGDVSSLSSEIEGLSGKVDILSGNVNTISSNQELLSGKVDTISSRMDEVSCKVDTLSGKVDVLSGDLNSVSSDVENLKDNVSTISSIVESHTESIGILSSSIEYLSAELDDETSARHRDIEILQGQIDDLSEELYSEIENRVESDEYLSAAIDTKQRQLSAGENIEITSGDEYDTISVTGLKTTTYFSGGLNKHTYGEYFTLEGNRLSANSAVGYFNLSIGYKVNTNETCGDNYYSASIKVNDSIVDTHYINGSIPAENHYISHNVLNDSLNGIYEIGILKDNSISISDVSVTCVGFIDEADPVTVGVLGTNGSILTFGNTVLRV